MDPAGQQRPSEEIRASDAERELVVARLAHAAGEGRLDLAETESRTARAYAASYRHELRALTTDLPAGGQANAAVPTGSAVWATIVWRSRAMVWGAERAGEFPPGRPQRQRAAVLAVVALVWVLCCALLGAVVVAA